MKTTTTSKASAKSATKTVVKTVPYFAALLNSMLDGSMGINAQKYYKSANAYHAKKQTPFPRNGKDNNIKTARANLTQVIVEDVVSMAVKGTLSSGNVNGMAVYDLMKIGAEKLAK